MISFSIGTVRIDEHGFCRIEFYRGGGRQLGVEEVKEMSEIVFEVCRGQKHKHLIDSREVLSPVLPGAREEVRTNEKLNACRSAAAMIVDNMANKMIINFFIRFNKPPYPYRVFENPEEAVKWLKSI